MLIDSHCHLDYFRDDEIDAVVARAAAAGVGRLITIGTRVAQAEAVKHLCDRFPNVWGTVGVHPHDAPYLAPVPFRGKRCEPAMVVHTAEWLARARGLSVAATQALTTENCLRLFDRMGPVVALAA
jgi:TatD DNase family protein